MDELPDPTIVQVLLALLPGFLTAEIVGALVIRKQRAAFERVVQALLFTFLCHVIWSLASWAFPPTLAVQHVGLGISALLLGLAVTALVNSDVAHSLLRWSGLTRSASRPSEWYDAFYTREWYVVLHLRDGRRLFGWPYLYSQDPTTGHIFLTGAEWLDTVNAGRAVPRFDLLVPVGEIQFVEFVPPKDVEQKQ